MTDMTTQDNHIRSNPREQGMVLLQLLAVSMPMVVLIGAASTTMLRRNGETLSRMRTEQAFLAAEAGVDAAIFRAQAGLLDVSRPFAADLDGGGSFRVVPARWGTDGIDNDGDGQVDEPDEDVVYLTITGTCGNVSRTMSVAMITDRALPFGPMSAIAVEAWDKIKFKLKGKKDDTGVRLSGMDRNLDGSRPLAPFDVPAITILGERPLAKLTRKLSKPKTLVRVEAETLIEVRDYDLDIDALADHVEANADFHATRKTIPDVFGDSARGDYRLTYIDGKLDIKRAARGAGVLVVDGELQVHDTFTFDGIILVRGKFELRDHSQIHGTVIVKGRKTDKKTGLDVKADIKLSDHSLVQYSTEALLGATAKLPAGILPARPPASATPDIVGWHVQYRGLPSARWTGPAIADRTDYRRRFSGGQTANRSELAGTGEAGVATGGGESGWSTQSGSIASTGGSTTTTVPTTTTSSTEKVKVK